MKVLILLTHKSSKFTLNSKTMKKTLLTGLTILFLLLFLNSIHAQKACNGSYAEWVTVPVWSGVYDTDNDAKDAFQAWIAANAQSFVDENGANPVQCSPTCPSNLPNGTCSISNIRCVSGYQMKKESWSNGNYRYSLKERRRKIGFDCGTCTEATEQILIHQNILPSFSTFSLCNLMPSATTLTIPPSVLAHSPGMNLALAQDTWLEWIASWNGDHFPASIPWGCPECMQTPGSPCGMVIDQTLSDPVPVPVFDGTQWTFPNAPAYNLVYSCSPCGAFKSPALQGEITSLNLSAVIYDPSKGTLSMKIENLVDFEDVSISLNDLSGKSCLQFEIENDKREWTTVPTNQLSEGIYVISLFHRGRLINAQKLLISKR